MPSVRYVFLSRHRKASSPSNPAYPKGVNVDSGQRPACEVKLPYPASCVGLHYVECRECLATAIITAAGRKDDPKSVMLPCRKDAENGNDDSEKEVRSGGDTSSRRDRSSLS